MPLHRSVAANQGLSAAQGDWILLLDDDDYIAPNHLEGLQATAVRSKALAAYSHCQAVDASGCQLPQCFSESFGRAKLLAGNFLPIHSVLFARSLLDLGCCFDPELDRFEDWDFWLQVAKHTDFIEHPVVSAFYRIDSSSGFGVHASAEEIRTHALALASKWRKHITPSSFLELMELARQYCFMERLQNEMSRLGVPTQSPEEMAQRIPEGYRKLKANTDRSAQEVRSCQERLALLIGSRSWRITAPLRWFLDHWRSMKKKSA
jgi:glycosyltransferase involved in cell wall biosynthesis